MDLDKLEVLKSRLCGIVARIKCSENERALAVLDIGDAIDMLNQAESDFWDLDGYLADIKSQDIEIDELEKKVEELSDKIEISDRKADDIYELMESMMEILKERDSKEDE